MAGTRRCPRSRACAPVIALTGRETRGNQQRHAYQEVDHINPFAAVTKYNATVVDLEQLPLYLRQAFREALSGTPGPVHLDLEGIAVSTGSACASGSLEPSHVLKAIGVPVEHAHGSIRLSMGRGTASEDVEYVLDRVPKVIGRIRKMSTAYAGS